MLSKQPIAWVIYAIAFLLSVTVLLFRWRNNLLLTPFILYGGSMAASLIYLLVTHSNNNISLDTFWVSKSLVFTTLPTLSAFLFIGIMEAQLMFIQHISIAIYNRDRWGSIYLRDPEKSQGFIPTSFTQNEQKKRLRPWGYIISIVLAVLYIMTAFICIIIELLTNVLTPFQRQTGISVCISIMCAISCINLCVIGYSYKKLSQSSGHIRMIRHNRDDMLFLRMAPLLLVLSNITITCLCWSYYMGTSPSLSVWIGIESVLVYLPILLIFIMCMYARRIKYFGRQYPIEVKQNIQSERKRKNRELTRYSVDKIEEIERITRLLSNEETNRRLSTPPPVKNYSSQYQSHTLYHPHLNTNIFV
ncbi:hypothetical protein BDB01DRAFT_833537 [Pilobolus umbonatus]|nr:hypothetical protein BDB01DRAFT_833537 [Pilobolus umbonatus]